MIASKELITVHGLGAAIPSAISLVLSLKATMNEQIVYQVKTNTVKLIDDVIPLDDVCNGSHNYYCSC